MVFNQPGPLKSPYPLSPRCVGDDMHHVTDGIWIGSHYVLKSSNPLVSRNIRNVINTAIEFVTENPELINWEELQQYGIEVHNTLWDDTLQQVIFPSPSLEAAVKKMDEVLSSGQPILVNCAMGKSRSSTLIIAYLMARKGIGYDEALQLIKKSRPQCQPNANFERQMRQLEQCLRANTNQTNGTSTALVPAARPASVPNPVHQNNNNTNSPFSYLSKYNNTNYSPSATYSRSLSPPGGRAQPNGFTSPHRAPLSPRASGAGPASPSPAQPSPHTSLGTHNHPLHNNHNYNKYLNNYPGAPNYSPAHTAYPSPNHNHANGPHATHTNGMGAHANGPHGHPHGPFPSPGHGPSAYASPPHAPFGSPGHNNRHNAHGHNYNSPAHNATNNNANNNNNRPNYSPYGNHFNPHSPYGGFGGGYGNYGFGNHGHGYGNRFSPGNHAMRRLSL